MMVDAILNEAYGRGGGAFHARRAREYWIEGVDGRRRIDLAMAGGSALLGHAAPMVAAAAAAQLADGAIFTTPNETAYIFAERLLQATPWFSSAVFSSTGSEATLRAIRLARAHTGRDKIAVFSGCWHGSHDMVLVEEDYGGPAAEPRWKWKSGGVPAGMGDWMLMLPYNDPAAFELIRRHRNELALVLIEPLQGSNPRDDIGGFLRELREVTRDADVLLCFDEVITGLRLALGGGQEYFGVQADLATYGKAIGGGAPIGMLAGIPEVMATIRKGRGGPPVFMGGTFSANPLTMAAGLAVFEYMAAHQAAAYGHLNGQGERLRREINIGCVERGLRAQMIGCGSMSRLLLTDRPVRSRRERDHLEVDMAAQARFYAALLEAGVHVGGNRINFLSMAHTSAIVDQARDAYFEVLAWFSRETGLI